MTDTELTARLRDFENVTVGDARDAANRIETLTAELAKAVDWFETIHDRAKGDYMAHTYYLDALAAIAAIKGEAK